MAKVSQKIAKLIENWDITGTETSSKNDVTLAFRWTEISEERC